MKKVILLFTGLLFLASCNMNPNKEERIQKLENELQHSQEKLIELEKKVKTQPNKTNKIMDLGAFSISLSVKDINVSKQFYEKFGFVQIGGGVEENYLIMKNNNAVIGLFQGMFEGNILTFNPGWDESGQETESYTDIREIQEELECSGVEVGDKIDKKSSGPASFVTKDPDGNMILIDQHR